MPLHKKSEEADTNIRPFNSNNDKSEVTNDKEEFDIFSQENQMSDIGNMIASNYSKFMKFINEFGYGMIILSIMAR